jgi:hypothetical protein
MRNAEGVRMGRGSEGIIFLIYMWTRARGMDEKVIQHLCGSSDARHVAFPNENIII